MDILGIFVEGLLSFLSPCVLPLVPLYISYLAGDSRQIDEEGKTVYKRSKVFVMTLFFTLGITCTFVLLSLTVSFLGQYIEKYSEIISIIGGTIIIIFGLHHTGLIHIDVLDRQLKLKAGSLVKGMNFIKAFLLGFVFSLGWSPCIGPMLANAILMATATGNYIYILVYGLGLVIPFIITGIFTSTILNLLNGYKNAMKYTLIVAGIVMIGFGCYMIYNASRTIIASRAINQISTAPQDEETAENEQLQQEEDIENYLMNYEFSNTDGEKLKLSDFKGKYVFLNFTTTWCTYCQQEIPIYKEFAENDEVKCFYVMSPLNEYSKGAIEQFISDKNIDIETIKDDEGILFYYCGITGYPTTYVISPEGKFLVYAAGAMNLDGFNEMLAYAKEKDQE